MIQESNMIKLNHTIDDKVAPHGVHNTLTSFVKGKKEIHKKGIDEKVIDVSQVFNDEAMAQNDGFSSIDINALPRYALAETGVATDAVVSSAVTTTVTTTAATATTAGTIASVSGWTWAAGAVAVIGGGVAVASSGGSSSTTPIASSDTTSPVITSGNTATAIAENSGAAHVIYTATATDVSTITYSLKHIGDYTFLSINSTTGAVTLTANPDFEIKPSYNFTVVATDSANNATEKAVTFAISNLDEVAPIITSGATATVAENASTATVIYTATATDTADTTAGVTYTLSGTDASLLNINSATGAVTLKTSANLEVKPSYSFTVNANDGVTTPTTKDVVVSVTNLDEVAPTITSTTTATAINENSGASQIIYTATSTDSGDIATGATTYTLKSGSDAGLTINATTGAVTLTANPDYETKSAYNFTVVATDTAGNASEKAVTLAINDLDENAPVFTSLSTATTAENVATTVAVYTATATDASLPLTYTISGTDAGLFNLDPTTGAVMFNTSPNFEAPSDNGANNVYDFTITATDTAGNHTDQAVAISVNAMNDAPIATADTAIVDEDTINNLISVLVNDTDEDGDALSVTAATATNGVVVINTDGTLSYTPNANYAGTDTINYTLTDGNGGIANSTVEVTVNDLMENGIFLDNYVSNLAYTSVSLNGTEQYHGITDSNGGYQYYYGGTTEFFIGGISIGRGNSGEFITVRDITSSNQEETNVARLLQTLDSNHNLSDGIDIWSGDAARLSDVSLDLSADSTSFEQQFYNTVYPNLSTPVYLVSAARAMDHASHAEIAKSLIGTPLGMALSNSYNFDMGIYNQDVLYSSQKARVMYELWSEGISNVVQLEIDGILRSMGQTMDFHDTAAKVLGVLGVIDAGSSLAGGFKEMADMEKGYRYVYTNFAKTMGADTIGFTKQSVDAAGNFVNNPEPSGTGEILSIWEGAAINVLSETLGVLASNSIKMAGHAIVKPDPWSMVIDGLSIGNDFYGSYSLSGKIEAFNNNMIAKDWIDTYIRAGMDDNYTTLLLTGDANQMLSKSQQIEYIANHTLTLAHSKYLGLFESGNVNYNAIEVSNLIDKYLGSLASAYLEIADNYSGLGDSNLLGGTFNTSGTENHDPVAWVDTATVTKDQTVVFNHLLDNDTDEDGDSLVIIDASSTHGTAVATTEGVQYTPAVGYTGYDSVFYDITDGHGGYSTGRVDVTVGNATEPSLAGQSVIDLGTYGKLINPVQVDGKWFYLWDRSGDGTSADTGSLNGGVDYATHDVLDTLFNHDVNGVTNTTVLNVDGNYGTTNDYRFATINGVNVALPTTGTGNANETGWYFLNDNQTYTDYAEIWDTLNTGYQTNGTPAGWQGGLYWSATPSTNGHAGVSISVGDVNYNGGNGGVDYYTVYVALQVL
jgi:hypothetical protein